MGQLGMISCHLCQVKRANTASLPEEYSREAVSERRASCAPGLRHVDSRRKSRRCNPRLRGTFTRLKALGRLVFQLYGAGFRVGAGDDLGRFALGDRSLVYDDLLYI